MSVQPKTRMDVDEFLTLIVDPKALIVIHHRRGADDLIETRIVSAGTLDLAPPGLSLSLEDVFTDL